MLLRSTIISLYLYKNTAFMKSNHLLFVKISLLWILALLFACNSKAQFTSAELGVDGLTCSACTRSVELSIRKLDFVKDVQMNLDNTVGQITFVPGKQIYIEKLAKAVMDAGFSVRYLQATFNTDLPIPIKDTHCFMADSVAYQFVKVSPYKLENGAVFKFIGKEFLSSKEYKKWKGELKPLCGNAKTVYYVTL
jgi:copper chaperone CopZ